MALGRKLKYGMVGGGPGAFIGAVHRIAAELDGGMEIVAGAFSSTPEKSRQQGKELRLDPDRVYGSYEEMAEKESKLHLGERIDFVSIVTPNNVHYPVAKGFPPPWETSVPMQRISLDTSQGSRSRSSVPT